EVRVGWGSPREVVVDGGRLKLDGEFDALAAQLDRVRARMPKGEKKEGGGGTTVQLKRFDVLYQGSIGKAELKSVTFERLAEHIVVKAEAGSADTSMGRATMAGGKIEIDRSGDEPRIAGLSTDAIELTADLGAASAVSNLAAVTSSSGDAGHRSRLATVRSVMRRASDAFGQYVHPEGVVELRGLRAQITRGEERFSVGPATLRFKRDKERVVGEYVAGASEESAAGTDDRLSIRASFPQEGEPLVVEMRGGPVSLAGLGLKEGEFHLVEVDRATFRANARFEIDPQGEVLGFDGEAKVENLSAMLPQIAKDPIKGVNASFRGSVRAALDGSNLSVKGGELELGHVRLATTFDASFEPPKTDKDPPRLRLDATYEVPLVPCQALVDAAPQGLLPTVAGMRLAGSFSLKGTAKFDTEKLDKTYAVQWDTASTCRVTEAPAMVDVARFKKAFKRVVYSPRGERNVEIETGPGTGAWARYGAISRHMELAVISFEDGRFSRHEGFDAEAIRNSIRENLRKWQFVRGASTISMQLAKNLYLERDKLLGRKIEEAFLTLYLEQALTKEQIIELYLNVVEFGPNVYGVQAASQHYFRTEPSSLSLSQAFYLASLLPNPHKEHFGAGGALSPGWLKLLRTVMKHANKVRRLTDEELEQGLSEIPVRGNPSPMRDPNAESSTSSEPGEATPEFDPSQP
ncbi:MAG: transglycosylase domain-containing protein, partial [Polyangiaceae bacterium]|nr:transglycosylase domain-containing protein [Polyangiaceae bacterium]